MLHKKQVITRREFLTVIGGTGMALSLSELSNGQTVRRNVDRDLLVYIGTYTSGTSKSEGIYIYKLNAESGSLTPHKVVKNVEEPSFLVIDKSRKYLYAVNETLEYEGKKSGAVSAFAIDQRSGDLKFLNKQASQGGAPCHVSISDNGKFVLVANYVGGNVATFPVELNGRLGISIDVEQHTGAGPNKERQEAPHAHSIIPDLTNYFVFVNDLGIDRVMIYKFDKNRGKLQPNEFQPFYETSRGAGPRHLVFHPAGKYAFLINELDSTISSVAFDSRKGTLKEIQTLSTLPAGFSGFNSCADIHVSPNGEFLYGSNRGHDSIVSYRIDSISGKLDLIEHVHTQGKTPRNFAIDPSGTFLLAANQGSDSIVTFRIDRKTGKLQPTGSKVGVPAPVCLKLIPSYS